MGNSSTLNGSKTSFPGKYQHKSTRELVPLIHTHEQRPHILGHMGTNSSETSCSGMYAHKEMIDFIFWDIHPQRVQGTYILGTIPRDILGISHSETYTDKRSRDPPTLGHTPSDRQSLSS